MYDFVQVTAAYSNAVLAVLLPIFSDFVKKMELPMPTPISTQQVERFVCNPLPGDVGGYLVATNGLELWYSRGHVEGFRTPRSYYNIQGDLRAEVPRFYGPLRLNRQEALALARSSLVKLGYSLKETFADQEPETDMPARFGTNVVPHYRFTWQDPVFGVRAVCIEVDANRKMVQEMRLNSKSFWRAAPSAAVVPRPLHPKPPVSATASNAYLAAMLPKVSDFASRLDLPIPLPVERDQLERVEFEDFDWVVMLKLRCGYWFDCEKDHVAGFNAPDCVFVGKPPDLPRPLEEYLGQWNLSERGAVDLARGAIRKLGHVLEEFDAAREPDITRRKEVGRYTVPRYFLRWVSGDERTGMGVSYVTAEVDADKKRLKHLYLLRVNAAGGSPTNAAPASALTNRRSAVEPGLEDVIKFPEKPALHGTNAPKKPQLAAPPPNPFESLRKRLASTKVARSARTRR